VLTRDEALRRLEESVVRIRSGSSIGTGFFVLPHVILTCAHAVVPPLDSTPGPRSLEIYSKGTPLRVADVRVSPEPSVIPGFRDYELGTEEYPLPDVAAVIVEASGAARPFVRLGSYSGRWPLPCLAFGAPRGYGVKPALLDIAAWANLDDRLSSAYRVIRLVGRPIDPGYSGSPVVVQETLETIGMVKSNLSDGGLGTPIEMTDAAFPELQILRRNEELHQGAGPGAARLVPVSRQATELKVAIGLVQHGGKVVLVCRKRPEGRLRWQFPAGVIKPGYSPHDVVLGEIFDETGITCQVVRYLGDRVHPETNVRSQYFHCRYLHGDLVNGDAEENSEVIWVDARRVTDYIEPDMIFPPVSEILDGSTSS